MHRVPRVLVADLESVGRALTAAAAATAVIDVEPMVAPWNCTDAQYLTGVDCVMAMLATAAPAVRCVLLASNSPRPRPVGAGNLVAAARKPWRTIYLRSAPRPIAVVGDQPLTDGLLAWRLGGTFIQWQHDDRGPWWPRLQRLVGQAVVLAAFRSPGYVAVVDGDD